MEKISQIISKIENNKNCIVSKLSTPYKNIPLDIPNDLKFYLENYESITFFQNSDYSIKTIGFSEFKRANEIILGENFEEDSSHNWFIIATIDTDKDRLGYCYDSFWDRYDIAGEQAIIAKSFTELLDRIYNSNGNIWYWIEKNFIPYGDAYDIK